MENLLNKLDGIQLSLNDNVKELKTLIINYKEMEIKKRIKKGDVAIVIGHTKLRKGACSPHGLDCEYDFNNKVAALMGSDVDIYNYGSYSLGYKAMVKKVATKLNRKNYKLVIELHYNAATPAANGTEAFYYYTNKKGKKIAENFCKSFCRIFKTKNRGAKAMVNSRQRGYWALFYPKATTVLLEPFFGTSRKDVSKIKGREQQYADFLKSFIRENL